MFAKKYFLGSGGKTFPLIVSALRLLCVILLLGLAPLSIAQNPVLRYEPGEVLVGVNYDADDETQIQRMSMIGSVISHSTRYHDFRLRLVGGWSVEAAVEELEKLPGVRYAEPDWLLAGASTPNDTYYNSPLISGYPSQYGPQIIQADDA